MVQTRIVSYNLLSSSLARSDHFTTYPPHHLLAENRLPIILEKLDIQRTKKISGGNSNPSTIFCLQEISREWAGDLHKYFANHNYQFITGLYGRNFNGYMGVGIAYPMNEYETIDVDIKRVSDTKPFNDNEDGASDDVPNSYWPIKPKYEKPKSPSLFTKLLGLPKTILMGVVTPIIDLLPKSDVKKDSDPWEYSQYRQNILVSVCLKSKTSSSSSSPFWVSCYHMPCAFWSPSVMTMHVEMVINYIQNILTKRGGNSNNNLPFIVTGDWNIKPTDTIYERLVSGEPLDVENDPAIPQPTNKYGKELEWILKDTQFQPMTSAYLKALGKEPEFTNWARVKDDEPFIDTLDYIFLSHTGTSGDTSLCDWNVLDIEKLPSIATGNGPYPNLDPNVNEPSDHILIAADIQLK